MGVPQYYRYPMPPSPFASFVEGAGKGMDQMSKLQDAREQIAASKQKRAQEAQQQPLEMQKLQATIDQIKSDTSLDPMKKQLYINQAKESAALAGYHSAETQYLPLKYKMDQQEFQARMQKLNQEANPGKLAFDKKDAEALSKSADEQRSVNVGNEEVLNSIGAIEEHYPKVSNFFKGGIMGNLASTQAGSYFTQSIEQVNKNSARLMLALQKRQNSGARMTDAQRKLISQGSVTLATSPAAAMPLLQQIKAQTLQENQKSEFLDTLIDNGLLSNSKAESLWNEFQQKYPAVDKKGLAQPQNAYKWKEFLGNKYGSEDRGKDGLNSSVLGRTVSEDEIAKTAKARGKSIEQVKSDLGIE